MTKKIKDTTGTIGANAKPGESTGDAIARKVVRPEVMGAITQHYYHDIESSTPIDISSRINALTEQIEQVNKGDMTLPETMLMAQAFTLDALFGHLARRARTQEQMKNYEGFMRMALRAQNQCRMTLETLSNIKNPPVIFAKQANISNGHQQINNGAPVSHTAENLNQQNELLTEIPNATLDSGRTSETISVNSNLETVG